MLLERQEFENQLRVKELESAAQIRYFSDKWKAEFDKRKQLHNQVRWACGKGKGEYRWKEETKERKGETREWERNWQGSSPGGILMRVLLVGSGSQRQHSSVLPRPAPAGQGGNGGERGQSSCEVPE